MKLLSSLAIAAALTVSGTAFSADLFKDNGCIVCHDVSAKKIGPTWPVVAAKLKADKTTVAVFTETLKTGIKKPTMGGKIPMPPQPKAVANAPALYAEIMKH